MHLQTTLQTAFVVRCLLLVTTDHGLLTTDHFSLKIIFRHGEYIFLNLSVTTLSLFLFNPKTARENSLCQKKYPKR